MTLGQLAREVESSLRDLLPGSLIPPVQVELEDKALAADGGADALSAESAGVIFSIAGQDERAIATPIIVPIQEQQGDGTFSIVDRAYASITWQQEKSALCWVLVAAVAIAIARVQGSAIEDNASFFIRENISSASELLNALKAEHRNKNFREAAERIYSKMPKSDYSHQNE